MEKETSAQRKTISVSANTKYPLIAVLYRPAKSLSTTRSCTPETARIAIITIGLLSEPSLKRKLGETPIDLSAVRGRFPSSMKRVVDMLVKKRSRKNGLFFHKRESLTTKLLLSMCIWSALSEEPMCFLTITNESKSFALSAQVQPDKKSGMKPQKSSAASPLMLSKN